MQVCPNCHYDNVAGVIFCERCGFALSEVSISTAQLGAGEDDLAAGSEFMAEDHVVILHIKGAEAPVTLQVKGQVVVGREGGEEPGFPFLNLEIYDAASLGVSRQHALFSRQDDQLFLRDLNSTNHTFLNGQELVGMRDYALRDGDDIALGRLGIRVFFK